MTEDFSKYNGEGTVLRKAQTKMLDILVEVDKVCRKHNITYWIDYGTLLGAIRHGGFVPWDDDMDICMLTEDYNRFQEIAPTELPSHLFLQTEKSDPSSQVGIGNMRVRDDSTLFIFGCENFNNNDHKGVFIDIFQILPLPAINHKSCRLIGRRIGFAYNFFKYNPALNFHNIICYFWYPIQYKLFKKIWKMIPKSKEKYSTTPEISGNSHELKIQDLLPLQEIEFEGHRFFAPKDIDSRLRTVYGDYMKIPSKEQQRIHAKYIVTNILDAKI
ncbi:MAG: LicD family protein [Bacteroidales bacterium]|nr:LicD family protein [Bacteroidales bacterium]